MLTFQFFLKISFSIAPLIGGILLLIFGVTLLSQIVGVTLCIFGVGFVWYMVYHISETLKVRRRHLGYGDLK